MKKQYYSPIKPYYKRKRIRIGYRIFKSILKVFFPKNEFVWTCPKPNDDEPIFFVSNHTKLYAPLVFILHYDKSLRLWADAAYLRIKDVIKHLIVNVIKDRKPKFLLYPLAILLSPMIVWFFRSIEPIPTFHQDRRVIETFQKSVETLKANISQGVFPEKIEGEANRYVFEFNRGFTHVAKMLYKETGLILKFYPTYVCQPLKKVLIGAPIAYDPNINMRQQKNDICAYLENTIKELGDSLLEHKISVYE